MKEAPTVISSIKALERDLLSDPKAIPSSDVWKRVEKCAAILAIVEDKAALELLPAGHADIVASLKDARESLLSVVTPIQQCMTTLEAFLEHQWATGMSLDDYDNESFKRFGGYGHTGVGNGIAPMQGLAMIMS